MKILLNTALSIGLGICVLGCKKKLEHVNFDGGSINVTNAIVNGTSFNMMADSSVVSFSNIIGSYNYAILPVRSGQIGVNIGIPPIPATPKTAAIPAVLYYSQTLAFDNATNYSLFLTGTSLAAVENVLIKENYARTYDDSVYGVRFINLAPGSDPISVNLAGSANGSESTGIAYKAYSDFVQHPARSADASYTFEFRDAGTGNLIATYTLATPFFHNVTLALAGVVGGSPAPQIILDKDY